MLEDLRVGSLIPDGAATSEARRVPGGWVYVLDGGVSPDGACPPERIRGAWRVDSDGKIVGEFVPNPNYISLEENGA